MHTTSPSVKQVNTMVITLRSLQLSCMWYSVVPGIHGSKAERTLPLNMGLCRNADLHYRIAMLLKRLIRAPFQERGRRTGKARRFCSPQIEAARLAMVVGMQSLTMAATPQTQSSHPSSATTTHPKTNCLSIARMLPRASPVPTTGCDSHQFRCTFQ